MYIQKMHRVCMCIRERGYVCKRGYVFERGNGYERGYVCERVCVCLIESEKSAPR